MKFREFLNNEEVKQLNEAAFGSGKMEQAANIIASYLAKKHFGSLYPYGGKNNYSEKYRKSNGKDGIGFRFISDSGKAIRIDFDSIAKGELSGVTVWSSLKNENPSFYISIPSLLNSIQAVQYIVSTILETDSVASVQNLQEEAINEKPRTDVHPSLTYQNGELKRFAWEAEKKFGIDLTGLTADQVKAAVKAIKYEKAGTETTSREQETTVAVKTLAAKKYADVDTVFDDLKDLVNMVVKGSQPSLLVTGSPGTGKTYSITEVIKQTLGSEGKNWILTKGKSSAMGLYATLFTNRYKTVVFDDCDSIFADKDAINLLKAALDSYDTRTISWFTKAMQDVTNFSAEELEDYFEKVEKQIKEGDPKVKYPNRFEFQGKIIFISNLQSSQIDSAVKSRSFVIDVTLSRESLIKRIESILPEIGGKVDLKIKKEVLEELKNYEGAEAVTMRSFLKALRLRESGSARWKELIRNYV